MTEKRFTFVQDSLVKADVFDEETGDFVCCTLSVWVEQLVDLLNQLNDENEQLKTTIQQLRTDNTKQKKKLNTAMKENEQLKCGNKNLKATLNDFINILNRLQSNPTDKQILGVARDMLQNMGVDLE